MDDVELTDEYWDCECEKEYIHLRSQETCPICKAEQEEQPSSRVIEVLKYGFVMRGDKTEISSDTIISKATNAVLK